ncbi:MAG: hypothetical protein E7258_03825 [Lachnospiraceae bacterium]|nr:hypothetical protein [Lachnospiraceae bacterium]
MKRPLLEAEKNYLKCAVLITLVGCGLWAMNNKTAGIICIVIGVLFAATAIVMYMTSDHEAAKKIIQSSKDRQANNKNAVESKKKVEKKENKKEEKVTEKSADLDNEKSEETSETAGE